MSNPPTLPCTLYQLLAQTAKSCPQSIALLAAGRSPSSYAQLLGQVDAIGQRLRAAGIGREDRVAVVLPNGPEMASAFLGVAAWSVCAPLNPAYRVDEFEFYLRDLNAKAMIVPAGHGSVACEAARRLQLAVYELDVAAGAAAGMFDLPGMATSECSEAAAAQPDDVALILHTSGTTSRPKQVPLTQANLCASALNISRQLSLSPDDRTLNVMPLFHIHGLVGALLSSLVTGASVVCASGFDSDRFLADLHEHLPTWYTAVPTMHQSVVAAARANPAAVHGHRLRVIRSSSSALPPTVMAELEELFQVPVLESYGMTEAAHQMASNPLPPRPRKAGSVGLPAGPDMAIMDDAGQLLPSGTIGEIVIRGDNVTKGYVGNPEANAAAFTNGWFRTGDLGRTDPDGYFYITGRKKEMINRGGENISPREIDEALLEHPAVLQAVAFAIPHRSLGEDIAAAVVLASESRLGEGELRDFARQRLADFKVPSRIVVVDQIPKGPTGKIQRIGLHEKLSDLLQARYVAPEGPVERQLANLWSELLADQEIGRDDNFFLRGGDSLLATRLLVRVRATWDLELPLSDLFQYPTLGAQALAIASALARAASPQSGVNGTDELESLLKQIEALSEDEALRLLENNGETL